MPDNTVPYDTQMLLDAFRELNNATKDIAICADVENDRYPEYAEAFGRSRAEFSAEATKAADAAEQAMAELRTGNTRPALDFLDRIRHVLGMMALATYDSS